ncbi:transposase [Planctomycetota bacterium]
MARPLRIEYDDAVYHVCARGNEGRPVFRDNADRHCLLETLGEVCERDGLIVHVYCLMKNHYHALVQTPRGNLSKAMGWVQSTYSIRHNRRHHRSGHLFQGRFKAHLVETDGYAHSLIRYIHLNPVRSQNKKRASILAGKERHLKEYRWSSHRAYADVCSVREAPDWLCLDWLRYFGRTRRIAQAEYNRQIAETFGNVIANPFDELRGGLVLGRETFWEDIKERLSTSAEDHVIRWRDRASREEIRERVAELADQETDRRVRMWLRVRVGGESVTSVAQALGYRDASGVSRTVQRLEDRARDDKSLATHLQSLRQRVNRNARK